MWTDYLPALFLAWSIQWMGVISPGPSVMLILGVATQHGRSASVVTAFGIACGSVILASATVMGITALLSDWAHAMTVLRWVGAAYLFWLAYKSLKTAWRNPPLPAPSGAVQRPVRTALTGFILQVSNPKAIGFWLAIAAVGGIGDAPASVIALFIFGALFNSFVGHGAYAMVLSSPPLRRGYARARRWIDGALGSLFFLAGLRLALSR
ncbi:MAG: LysE family translocator [Devosiaceae bacterium]|nr:LysE family translocator [Devosiaceae bacterium MH13]